MKKLILTLVALIILAVAAAYVFDLPGSMPVPDLPDSPDSAIAATTTVVGSFVCLPHRNTEGPQTMECAFGMKGEDGSHYALDWSNTPVSAFDLPMDRRYSVTGLYLAAEALSSDHWQNYGIKGVIQVSSYEELASDIPVLPIGSTATLELKKPVTFKDTTIRVWAVTEDSRCPTDVTCIQAGRVKAALSIESPSGTSSMPEIEPGDTVTTETLSITLDSVTPHPVSTRKITDEEYRFVFTVTNK